MILTLTGASGAGKSTLAKAIIELMGSAELSPGCSTRSLRPGETSSDVVHVSHTTFFEAKERGDFLWSVEVHGEWYGTLRRVIKDGLANPDHCLLLVLASSVLPILKEFALECGHGEALRSIYIVAPNSSELRARLNSRESDANVIERRISDCLTWDEEAQTSGLYDMYVPGEGDVNSNALKVIETLRLS